MKTIWILTVLVTLGLPARADSLGDEVKNFTDALKSNAAAKPGGDPMGNERMAGMAAQFQSQANLPGGEAQIEAMVTQLMATNPTDAVQTTGKALIADLESRRKARADALKAQVDDVLAPASDILVKAQKTQQLDGILNDLQKVHVSAGNMYDSDSQSQMNRVNSAYQFVAQWQDYLSARNSGNMQAAQETLRNLSNSNRQGDAVLVPRSEILARIVELATQIKPAPGATPASPNTPPAIDTESILAGVKTPDDMEPALKALRAVPNNQTPETQALGQQVELYANARNGLPVILATGNPNYLNGNTSPELVRIKAMLLLYLLPKYIGGDAPAPNPGEGVSDYVNRAIDTAAAKQDWAALQRAIEADKSITSAQGAFQSGARNFFAGLNQEIAGQYALAVSSYQSSLRDPDDAVPAKVVGDRLAAIQKDHPADYAEGMKNFTNPPSMISPMAMRAAMMGYPVPGNPAPGVVPALRLVLPAGSTNTNSIPAAPTASQPATDSAPAAPGPSTK